MTYKAAITGLNIGGGKAVIIGDAKTKNTRVDAQVGEFVHR
jgi:leucine dehydrogenase